MPVPTFSFQMGAGILGWEDLGSVSPKFPILYGISYAFPGVSAIPCLVEQSHSFSAAYLYIPITYATILGAGMMPACG
jgi:hypothetical protein